MSIEFNYDELLEMTSKEFAEYIQEGIDRQKEIRDVMAYRVRIDRHGLTEEEAKERYPEDAPIVVVDYLSGWNGVPDALWTYWFDTHTKKFDSSVVNKETFNRFHALESGAAELPELGFYSFPADPAEPTGKLYTITPYRYFVKPVSKVIKEHGITISVTTWKYDDDQRYFNFEVQFPIEQVKDEFHWEAGSFFLADLGDSIQDITSVLMKDGFLIIGGLKKKGNEANE
ncbi:hypothetical protein ABES02_28615 [Neobacillus pocheonensis]|uniref:hypothetical protein n=1 Tax=Neobacillus pocheonensis TaxID=363869 RepID=UPI003D2C7CA2